jgi:hypothetical protein
MGACEISGANALFELAWKAAIRLDEGDGSASEREDPFAPRTGSSFAIQPPFRSWLQRPRGIAHVEHNRPLPAGRKPNLATSGSGRAPQSSI